VFSVNDFYYKGYSTFQLDENLTNQALDSILEEHMVKFENEKSMFDDGEKNYKERFIAKSILFKPRIWKKPYEDVLLDISKKVEPVLHKSSAEINKSNSYLMPLLGMPGYMMDLHSDEGDRASVIAILYLSEDDFSEESGGSINFYDVTFDNDMKVKEKLLIEKIMPKNGRVVVINPSNPSFKHEVEPLREDKKRYSIFMCLGTEETPDWEVEYTEKKGCIDLESLYGTEMPVEEKNN